MNTPAQTQEALLVRFHDIGTIPEWHVSFVVLLARHQGRWVYVRHRERTTWEIPGGHREPGEWLNASAERELFEETGATVFSLEPLCDYEVDRSVENPPPLPGMPLPPDYLQAPGRTFGRLYFTDIQELDDLPDSEIAEVRLFDNPPANQTYPSIQPHLLQEGARRLASIPIPARDRMLRLISPFLQDASLPFSLTIGLPEAAIGTYARITRQAVRLVAVRDGRLLLVRNRREDVKFPGGGIEPGETDLQALQRECREETGYSLSGTPHTPDTTHTTDTPDTTHTPGTPRLLGTVVERHYDGRAENTLFEMTSRYYLGEVGDQVWDQQLDDYEADMAFEPVWVTVQEACDNNLRLVDGPESGRNRWVIRDTAVLVLIGELLNKSREPNTWSIQAAGSR